MIQAASRRYAKALLETVGTGPELEPAGEALGRMVATIAGHPDLLRLCLNPVLPAAEKRKVLLPIAERLGLPGPVREFVILIVQQNEAKRLGGILEAFEALIRETRCRLRVIVRLAHAAGPSLIQHVKEGLKGWLNRELEVEVAEDTGLGGGMVVEVGSRVYDGSLRGRFDQIRKRYRAMED
jgi:F-type H+-transporting ATPase subunit delta